jgi:hypothetical protein
MFWPALLAVLAIAGCGGGSSETTSQPETQAAEPATKADYVAFADVICRNHESRTADLESQTIELGRLDSERSAHQVAEILRQESDNLSDEVRELQARPPPPADVDTVRSVLSLMRAKADAIEDWAKAYDELDTLKIRTTQARIGAATAKLRSAAGAYGFEVCGQG